MLRLWRFSSSQPWAALVLGLVFCCSDGPLLAFGCYRGEIVEALWPGNTDGRIEYRFAKVTADEPHSKRLVLEWQHDPSVCERKAFCKIVYRFVRRPGSIMGRTCEDDLDDARVVPADTGSLRHPYVGPNPAGDDPPGQNDTVLTIVLIISLSMTGLFCMIFVFWYISTQYNPVTGRESVAKRARVHAASISYDLPDFNDFMKTRPEARSNFYQISDVARAYLPTANRDPPRVRPTVNKKAKTVAQQLENERLHTLAHVHFSGMQRGGADFLRPTPAFRASEREILGRIRGEAMQARRVIVRERGVHIPDADYYSTPEGRRMRQISVKRPTEISVPGRSGSAPGRSAGAGGGLEAMEDREDTCFRPALQSLVAGIGAKKFTKQTKYGQRDAVLDPGNPEAFLTAGPPGPDVVTW